MRSVTHSSPLVSVILPVFNGERYLAEAIESVLSQTYQRFELVVVDDGSTDKSREIALSYPAIIYVYQENGGTAAARNYGIKVSRGQYLGFLDADDLWMPEKLNLQINAFNTKPEVEIVTGQIEQFISPDLDMAAAKKYSISNEPVLGYSSIAILLKRSTLDTTGLFHEDIQAGETISWFTYLIDAGLNILFMPDVVARRRIHGENISLLNKQQKGKAIIGLLKRSIDRKRMRGTDEVNS